MYWIVILLVVVLFAFLIRASVYINSGIYINAFCKADVEEKAVAITFDDGPDEIMTIRVLDVLHKHNAKAVFFLIGDKVVRNSEIVKQIVQEGHIIGNHTYSHKFSFPFRSYGKVVNEIKECNDVVERIINKKTKLFRPPFGVTNPRIGRAIKFLGLHCVGWSVRSFDTVSCRSRDSVLENIVNNLHNGAIILLHDRCDDADVLLDALIERILDNGYKIKPIDELLKIQPYED